jgi:hypothetical protein
LRSGVFLDLSRGAESTRHVQKKHESRDETQGEGESRRGIAMTGVGSELPGTDVTNRIESDRGRELWGT